MERILVHPDTFMSSSPFSRKNLHPSKEKRREEKDVEEKKSFPFRACMGKHGECSVKALPPASRRGVFCAPFYVRKSKMANICLAAGGLERLVIRGGIPQISSRANKLFLFLILGKLIFFLIIDRCF